MLTRRQLRIKALQTLYSHYQTHSDNLIITEKQLLQNISQLYDLQIYQLSLLVEVVRFASQRIEEAKLKHLPSDEDLNPNTKFIDNQVIGILINNRDFNQKVKALKIDWSASEDMIRKLYLDFKEMDVFQNYINDKKNSFKSDQDILMKFVQSTLVFSDVLNSYFEEIHSMWSEDFYMAFALVLTTIGNIDPKWTEHDKLPTLFKTENDDRNDDKQFLLDLVRKTIVKTEKYDQIIKEKAQNWEFDRIALMDLILLRMAMVEIFDFPTIPLKVTLNETIELAKHFSSPKASIFVNGILDRTIAEGLSNKTIVKQGRGLVGN